VAEDAAILQGALRHLEARGCQIGYLEAENLPVQPPAAAGALHMAQGPEALKLLARWEAAGLPLINSPGAVIRCSRRHLFAWLALQSLACPATRFFSLEEAREQWTGKFPGPGWLKRADIHAEGPGDVVRVHTLTEALQVLADFSRRGLAGLVWQEHVSGDEIKFYAVGPGRFFQAYFSSTGSPVTGPAAAPLEELARRLARTTGLEVFGGDVILTPEDDMVLIDLNDWPSFSRCAEAAAQEIAHHAQERLGL
jgi:glutathione synthase/RimK-type ligase-like ATP-grasp enzyme